MSGRSRPPSKSWHTHKTGALMKIAFIGLGIMGSRMAANLQKAGHTVVVHNRTRDKAEKLPSAGATWAPPPAEAARQADIVFTMLAPPEAVREAALGRNA